MRFQHKVNDIDPMVSIILSEHVPKTFCTMRSRTSLTSVPCLSYDDLYREKPPLTNEKLQFFLCISHYVVLIADELREDAPPDSRQKNENPFYKSVMCRNAENCSYGGSCVYAHDESELRPVKVIKENLKLLLQIDECDLIIYTCKLSRLAFEGLSSMVLVNLLL